MNSPLSEHQRFSGSPADRRGHPRHRLAAPVSVHTGNGQTIAAMTLEISESGLSAVLATPVRVGATVQLDLVPAGTVTAQVRHNVGRVYGFEFLQITEEQINQLRNECRRLPLYPANKMGI